MFKYLFVILMPFLLCCGNDPSPEKQQKQTTGISVQADKKAQSPHSDEPTSEEIYEAAHLVAFANHAKGVLSHGFHFLPDALANNTRFYLATWQLPPRPKHPVRDNDAFIPPAGLFTEQETSDLESAYKGMNAALNNLLGHYASLEKYVANKNIRDDGKRGVMLANQVLASHKQFIAARHDWLEIVNRQAQKAEAILLTDHPLQRQILAAQNIMSQFGEVTSLLASGNPERALLAGCLQTIESLAKQGGMPPFPARPALERLYRQFLKDVGKYVESLDGILRYGDHEDMRRQLNYALRTCQKSYNAFAAQANSEP